MENLNIPIKKSVSEIELSSTHTSRDRLIPFPSGGYDTLCGDDVDVNDNANVNARDLNPVPLKTDANENKSASVSSDEWIFSIPNKGIQLSHPLCNGKLEPKLQPQESSRSRAPSDVEPLGWKFENKSTNWHLSSKSILSVTYTSTEQALPSYTNQSIGVDYIQRMCKRVKCRRSRGNGKGKGNEFSCFKKKKVFMETYDADDIMSVKFLDKKNIDLSSTFMGTEGACQGVQIFLRSKGVTKKRFPNPTVANYGNVNVEEGNATRIPKDGKQILKDGGFLPTQKEGMDDGIPIPPWCQKGDDITGNDQVHGPIVTFLLHTTPVGVESQAGAPPLLWKVQFPPDPSIALEAFTVLDGSLDVHSESESSSGSGSESNINANNNSPLLSRSRPSSYIQSFDTECTASHPTNIYINGYQSWSFAGSVTRGDEQPKSAMPDLFSKAFNFGAEIPPAPTEEEAQFEGSESWRRDNGNSMSREKRAVHYHSDGEDDTFHDLTHYKSDFFTCITSRESENAVMNDDNDGLDNGNENNNKCKLDQNGGPAMVLGFLSQLKQYGLITFDSDLNCVAMHASLQGIIASRSTGVSTDWAFCQIMPEDYYDEEPMQDYLHAVTSHNTARAMQRFPPLTGWCSWYHYYENIDASTLKENFGKLASLKSKITSDAVIIDDGYMTAWGDWSSLKPKGFPSRSGGMKGLADSITSNEMIPGIWLAPYACDKNSKLAKEHPDWIIRNDQGRIANSSNCGKFFYGLDATNPAVREYAFTCIRRAVKDWGYKVLKLDFLYAACLVGNGKYDMSMSRAETMHLALCTLRAAAGPDTFIIGCGCPIGPGIGLIDANRISADTGPTWYAEFPLPWWDHGTLPSLRAMIRNTITRSYMSHRFWHNDPDCILLGDTTRLTETEVKSAATIIAMTGGMLLLSDDLCKLSNERLRVASRIFPVTGVPGIVLDLHNTSESGIPSLMRLWCTDEVEMDAKNATSLEIATNNAKRTSISSKSTWNDRTNRNRSCIPVTKGLGTWAMLSLSNWLDKPAYVSVPFSASLPINKVVNKKDPDLGYHVFSFWTSKYAWVASDHCGKNIRKKLGPHESEIFHVKPVSFNCGQYIGSELHFTCGYEVVEFSSTGVSIDLQLRNDLKRSGFVYLYLPRYSTSMKVTMSGMAARVEVVSRTPKIGHNNAFYGGQVIRVWVVINGNKAANDGRVTVKI